MRPNLDGVGETMETTGSLDSKRAGVAIIRGEGLPNKVGIGAMDLPDEVWLDLQNRDLRAGQRYTSITRVRLGAVALDKRHLQGSDQTYGVGGTVFRTGTMSPDEAVKPGAIVKVSETEIDPDGDTAAWLIMDDTGRKFLMVMPHGADSDVIVESMERFFVGKFQVASISAGVFTGAEDLAVPGWTLIVDDREAPSPQPPR